MRSIVLGVFLLSGNLFLGCAAAFATKTPFAINWPARTACAESSRIIYLQGQGGDPPASYSGRVFKLSQNYPNQLPPMEDYPWLKIGFKNGGPVDPRAYLQALLDYGLEGNVEANFYVEDNKVRKWYGMPWMDWNTEVASDWPGTDGREFVHGFTHEFDSSGKTLSTLQNDFVDTWSGGYFNDRAAFGIGQVYCDPDNPKPGALNPDPAALNNFPNGSYHHQAPLLDGDRKAVADRQRTRSSGKRTSSSMMIRSWRNKGPISRFARAIATIRLIQIDVSVRDDRSITGWLLGTFGYDGRSNGRNALEAHDASRDSMGKQS